jgi:RecB family endonuclease NucS
MPHPEAKVRENAFPDKTRSDVLLVDREGTPVVVECKQGAPTLANISQPSRVYEESKKIERKEAHERHSRSWGAASLRNEVIREVSHDHALRVIRYSLHVDFAPFA